MILRYHPSYYFLALADDSPWDKVDWDGLDDPDNPKNWTDTKRWRITVLNSLFMFVSPVSSSMVAPAFQAIRTDLSIKSELITQMVLSVFILASAVGPLVISPLSEVYGRLPVLHVTCLIYTVFNLACAFSKTSAQLLIFRWVFCSLSFSQTAYYLLTIQILKWHRR